MIIRYRMAAFICGFLLDQLLGDPYWLPHPIRLIGTLISKTETFLRGSNRNMAESTLDKTEEQDKKDRKKGILFVCIVCGCTLMVSFLLLKIGYQIHPFLGFMIETIMTYQILAAKCLKVESMKVYQCLKRGELEASRKAVSMIVGRDTAVLNEEGVAKAAIETVAENTSDGVIAPMIYTAIGGPVLGFFYKAVNTMDSMVGYKNDRYLYFGRAAARLDDLVNYIPSRISAYLMIVAAYFGGSDFSGRRAFEIYRRDNRNHASPNSAQTEAACAGALGIRLAGDASYFGKIVKKPFIGDAVRPVEYEDIRRVNRLMYGTAWFCFWGCLAGMILIGKG